MKNGSQETTFVDHLLVLIACSTALWSLGESLSRHNLARFITIGSIVSLTIGYWLSTILKKTKIIQYDSYLWTVLAFLAAVSSPFLNRVLPDEGFPFVLFAGTWLSWMVILCGLVSWRDQTLLFLNIPCLSVFALVGTFDTYPPSTVLFFLFLVCSSVLYARIHKRTMVRRAMSIGVEDPALLERDSWRWMAGPEWAMASAGVIVLVSLLVGPILRYSLQSVSGSVPVTVPGSATTASNSQQLTAADMMVGRGQVELDETPAFKIKTDRIANLRQNFFTDYVGTGWMRLRPADSMANLDINAQVRSWPHDAGANGFLSGWPKGVPIEPLPGAQIRSIEVLNLISGLNFLPTPGPILDLKTTSTGNIVFTASGTAYKRGGFDTNEKIVYRYLEPRADKEAGRAVLPKNLDPIAHHYLGTSKIRNRTFDFARKVTAGAKTDFEKAEMLQHAIENQAAYTLNPPALSTKEDAVEQFLFETKRGYCDLFGTAMAVCARAVGLPSRYAVGYSIGSLDLDDAGYLTVRQRDAHAWAEIYFEGKGWVVFDPTEGATLIDEPDEVVERPWYQQPMGIAAIVGATAFLGLVIFLIARGIKSASVTRSLNNGTRAGAMGLHGSFDRIVRQKTGVTRRFSQTTKEYVAHVAPKLGEALQIANELVPLLEASCYGPELSRSENMNTAKDKIRDLRRIKVTKPRP